MYKGCINMLKKRKKNGFTLVELLAVIVILAVVILIAVTAVIPRMNNAKKKALVDEALMYLKAAKESIVFDADQSPSCINVSNLNEKYIKKSSDSYTGVVKNEYINGELSQTINLTNGNLYIVGTDNLTSSDVKSTIPKGFAASCADYNPILAENADTNTLAYKLLMSEGGSTLDDNLSAINQRTSTVNFNAIETDASKSGLYKAEDDDGASFYYRGVVNNNWVEFGGFYWRVLRINGDGSIRLFYSGTANSTHTGIDATIKNDKNGSTSRFSVFKEYYTSVKDISGLTSDDISIKYTNGVFGHTYPGYMYNPKKTLMSFQTFEPDNSNKLNVFTLYTGINNTKNDYYFFKNFDMNTDCFTGSDTDDSGSCVLKCRSLGDDCTASNWNTLATTEGNYSTTAAGVYPASNPTNYIYTSPYKYTCWGNGTPVTKNNSDGTTSVYISCTIVSEIVGTIKNQPTQARIRVHGLFAPDYKTATEDIYDSNIKTQLEYWYENNIYNRKDSENSNANYLENYIADEIFCNDRDTEDDYPFPANGNHFMYNSYNRIVNLKKPTLKCTNINRDGYTIVSDTNSIVSSKGAGNNHSKYPIGTITVDEVVLSGGKYNTANTSSYIYINFPFFTLTPYNFYAANLNSSPWYITATGSINGTPTTSSIYIRPVINLKASVLYDSGSGIEADPYKVKLSS